MSKDLLHACLSEGEIAIESWKRWFARGGLDELTADTFRMLPLAHSNLARIGYSGAEMGRLLGIRKKFWVEGEQRVHRALPELQELKKRFGNLTLLKGLPLASGIYQDLALRPMADIDVLVEEDAAIEAVNYFQSSGWEKVIHPTPLRIDREFLTFRHSIGFRSKQGVEFDLHWSITSKGSRPGIDEVLRKTSVPFEFRGFSGQTLCNTGHFFHTLIHGSLYNPLPAYRWVADAVWLLRHSGGIDFRRFEELVRVYDVAPYIHAQLQILYDDFGLQGPSFQLEPAGWWLKQEFKQETMNWYECPPHTTILATLYRYRRTGASFQDLGRLARFCQFQWDLTTKEGWQNKLKRLRA